MEVLTTVDEARIRKLLEADDFFWLDLTRPAEADLRGVQNLLGIHPAAIEDSMEWSQLPKADDYGRHVLLVFFSAGRDEGTLVPIEVHVHLSGSWALTVRQRETPLDAVHERLR